MIPAHEINAHSKKSSYFKSRNFPVVHNVAFLVVFLSVFVSVYGDDMEVTFGESSTFSYLTTRSL